MEIGSSSRFVNVAKVKKLKIESFWKFCALLFQSINPQSFFQGLDELIMEELEAQIAAEEAAIWASAAAAEGEVVNY